MLVLKDVAANRAADSSNLYRLLHARQQFFVAYQRAACNHDGDRERAGGSFKRGLVAAPVDLDDIGTQFTAQPRVAQQVLGATAAPGCSKRLVVIGEFSPGV